MTCAILIPEPFSQTGKKVKLSKVKLFDLFYNAYHSVPQIYDGITQLFSIGQWEKWQDHAFEDLTGKKILEIGVGPGKMLLRIAKKGYRVTGIELRKGMAYEARKKVRDAGYDVDILNQSVYKMPFQDETFDCIVMTFVLAEITDLDRAIVEMKRVLKKNGKVVIIAGGIPQNRNMTARILFKMVGLSSSLHLERDNKSYFMKHGFIVTRVDFGPFNIINKIVAVKKQNPY